MKQVLVVYKKSTFELYSNSDDGAVKAAAIGDSENAKRLQEGHEVQQRSLERIASELESHGVSHEMIYRADLERINDRQVVLSVGGDGTVLEVSHYVSQAQVMGINSDPSKSRGFFCCYDANNFWEALGQVLDGNGAPKTNLNRMAVAINGEMIPELALNDVLYANSNPASTSRYTVKAAEASDSHKDSGLLVCTAAGSTAWTYEEGGRVMSPVTADLLQFIPRGKRNAKPEFAFKIKLVSFTRQGELFVDGPHLRYPCGLEAEAVFSKGTPLTLVGDLEAKRPDYR